MKNLISLIAFRKSNAFKIVFDTSRPEVRTVLAELKRICPSDPAKNAGNPLDEKKVWMNIGAIKVLNHIMALINLPDEKIMQIMKEEKNIYERLN